jgi:hypothetical protein
MKTVVFDSPHVDHVAMPSIGKAFERGKEVVLTDEDAEIALQNPHVRLATDKETVSQRVAREAAEPKSDDAATDVSAPAATIVTPPPKTPEASSTVLPSVAPAS